jgi:hypothetical protein
MINTLHSRGYRHFNSVFYSDEAQFHQSGHINSQKSRLWSDENLHTFHERPLHSLQIEVWCAVSQQRITGPIFFSKIITTEFHQELIMNFISHLETDEQNLLVSAKWGCGTNSKFNNADVKFSGGHIIS